MTYRLWSLSTSASIVVLLVSHTGASLQFMVGLAWLEMLPNRLWWDRTCAVDVPVMCGYPTVTLIADRYMYFGIPRGMHEK